MAGPQDYLTVQGPSPASYALPKFDLGSQIAQIPQSYQEGQQYGVTRALQTMFKDGYPTKVDPQTGQQIVDLGAIAQNILKVAGPKAAEPYLELMLKQQSAQSFPRSGDDGQSQGEPNPPPQTPTPMAPNSATGRAGITGEHPSTGGGSIFPYTPGTSPPQIVGGGPAPQPQGGAGLQGQPAPFAGNRDQQGAPPGPVGGGTPAFNDRVAQYGGMSNRPSVTEDGTTGQPTGPTSSREVAISSDPVIKRQQSIINKYTDFLGGNMVVLPGQENAAKAAIAAAQKAIEQRTDALNKRAELTPEEKNLQSGAIQKSKELEGDIARSQKTYGGMHAISNQFETGLEPAIQVAKGILNRPEMYSGIGGQLSLDFNKVRAALGDRSAATLQEGLQKINAISVLAQVNQQKDEMQETGATSSRIFSQQVDQVAKASASMENTVNGNRFLVNFQDRMGQFSKALTAQAQAYIQAHGHLDVGFDKQVSDYIAKNPIFTPQERADPRILGAPEAPATVRDKAGAAAWKASMGLTSGDPYRTPDGRVLYVK